MKWPTQPRESVAAATPARRNGRTFALSKMPVLVPNLAPCPLMSSKTSPGPCGAPHRCMRAAWRQQKNRGDWDREPGAKRRPRAEREPGPERERMRLERVLLTTWAWAPSFSDTPAPGDASTLVLFSGSFAVSGGRRSVERALHAERPTIEHVQIDHRRSHVDRHHVAAHSRTETRSRRAPDSA